MPPSISLKLLPVLVFMTTSCSDNEATTKKLRNEIELNDRQKETLQSDIGKQELMLAKTASELEQIRLAGGPEVVAKAESERALAVSEKARVEKVLAQKEVELKDSLAKLEHSRNEQEKLVESASKLAVDISTKTNEINSLNQKLLEVGLDAEKVKKLREGLDASKKDLAELQTRAKKKEEELTDANLKLKDEIKTKLSEVDALKSRVKELAEGSSHATALSEAQVKLENAKKELEDLQIAKTKTDLELKRSNKILDGIMLPIFGMYYSELESLTFDGKKCRQFVYVETNGDLTQAVLCQDNRAQITKHTAKQFGAVVEKNFSSEIGLKVKTEMTGGSCGVNKSMFETSSTHTFEKFPSFHDTTGSVHVAYELNGSFTSLVSSAMALYTENCVGLLKFAENETVLDPTMLPVLKQSAQICNLVRGNASEAKLDIGCFTAANQFVK